MPQADLVPDSGEGQALGKPRALILDIFGDYLRYTDAQAKAGDLVDLLGVFGVEPATVRVTLSRLRREEWFTTRREGREVTYVLSAHMMSLLEAGRERIFADYGETWDRSWTTVIHEMAKPDRLSREQLRRQLSWLGFGSLAPNTWIAPRRRADAVGSLAAEFPDVSFTLLRSQTGDLAIDRELAARCWDLGRINERYRQFVDENAHLADRSSQLSGAAALVARTVLIANYRHFPFLDPWLPAELQPDGWLGEQANGLFRAAHRKLGPAAPSFVGDVIGRPVDAPLI